MLSGKLDARVELKQAEPQQVGSAVSKTYRNFISTRPCKGAIADAHLGTAAAQSKHHGHVSSLSAGRQKISALTRQAGTKGRDATGSKLISACCSGLWGPDEGAGNGRLCPLISVSIAVPGPPSAIARPIAERQCSHLQTFPDMEVLGVHGQ